MDKVMLTAGAGRASLGGRAARGSGARGARCGRVGSSGNGASGREEVRAVALLLTVGVLLSVGGSASALRASSDTAVGVVGLAVAGARDLVALSNAADISGLAYCQDASALRMEMAMMELRLDSAGSRHLHF